jgi:hypothetical protein
MKFFKEICIDQNAYQSRFQSISFFFNSLKCLLVYEKCSHAKKLPLVADKGDGWHAFNT